MRAAGGKSNRASRDLAPRARTGARLPRRLVAGILLVGAGAVAVAPAAGASDHHHHGGNGFTGPGGPSGAAHQGGGNRGKAVHTDANGGAWPPDPSADTTAPVIPSSVSVSNAQAWLAGALSLRSQQLGTFENAVTNATDLPQSVQSSLEDDLSKAADAVSALAGGVPKDTTLDAIRSDAAAMVALRVISVVVPQAHLVLEAERQLTVAEKIARLEPAIETAIKTEQSTKASGTLADLASSLSGAVGQVETSTSSVVPDLLAQSTADPKDATAAIAADQKALSDGWTAISAAKGDLHRIVALLARPN